MSLERWGSLSVTDHLDTRALVANVLLYDRLIFPAFTEASDRDERFYWLEHGWDPDLQARRLDQLGDLAIRKPWDEKRRRRFRGRYAELMELLEHGCEPDGQQINRDILADERQEDRPAGMPHPDVIAAYNSLDAIRTDYTLETTDDPKALQACLVARKLAIPDLADPEAALQAAIDLSREDPFRERRADLFDWQAKVIEKGYTPEEAVHYMDKLTDAYNEAVARAHRQVRYRFAFVIGGVALGLLGAGLGQPIASASAILALVQFGTLDKRPVIEAGNASPMAAFHDIKTRLGLAFGKG
jgi:hypothetical protein